MGRSFSIKPWEIENKLAAQWNIDSFPNLFAVWVYDAYIEKILLKYIAHFSNPENLGAISLRENQSIRFFQAQEISTAWFESEFQTMDFFRSAGTYCILQCEKLKPDLQKYIIESANSIAPNHLVCLFSKDHAFFKELGKVESTQSLKIMAPAFWESRQLLEYLAKHLGVALPHSMLNYIQENLNPEVGDYIQALKFIKLHQASLEDQNKLDWEGMKQLLAPTRLDHFKLARLLSQKKFHEFYHELCTLTLGFEELGQFFGFLQGHLLKLLDPSYINKKPKPSQYDKEIQRFSGNWTSAELIHEMRFWGEMQILAKQKSPQLENSLRESYIKLI